MGIIKGAKQFPFAATNSVVALEFYQAEVYLLTQIRAQIMQQIPTYGQLVAASKKK